MGQPGRRVKKIWHAFTRSEGLKANLDRVEDILEAQAMAPEAWFSCEVFLADGTRVPIDSLDDLNTVRAAL